MGRRSVERDRIITARLQGASSRHARYWRKPTGEALEEALTELREIAGGRTDLLGEVAGILLGVADVGNARAPVARIQAELLIQAGADLAVVEEWRPIGAGRERETGPPLSGHAMRYADTRPYRWPPHGTRRREDRPACPACGEATERVYYVDDPAGVIALPCGHRTFVIDAPRPDL